MINQDKNEVTKEKQDFMKEKIVNWMLAGNSRIDILELIRLHAGNPLTDIDCNDLLEKSKQLLQDTVSTDPEQEIALHIGWYEDIFKYFESIKHTEGMNKALQAKEKLLAMTGTSKVIVNKNTEVNIIREEQYDLSKLSPAQRERMEYLLAKTNS